MPCASHYRSLARQVKASARLTRTHFRSRYRHMPESPMRVRARRPRSQWAPSPSPRPPYRVRGRLSPVKRPLRNLPDEAMSGVSNDTTVAKPPPFWIPAFAGMTVVQRSRQGRGDRSVVARFCVRRPGKAGFRPAPMARYGPGGLDRCRSGWGPDRRGLGHRRRR